MHRVGTFHREEEVAISCDASVRPTNASALSPAAFLGVPSTCHFHIMEYGLHHSRTQIEHDKAHPSFDLFVGSFARRVIDHDPLFAHGYRHRRQRNGDKVGPFPCHDRDTIMFISSCVCLGIPRRSGATRGFIFPANRLSSTIFQDQDLHHTLACHLSLGLTFGLLCRQTVVRWR